MKTSNIKTSLSIEQAEKLPAVGDIQPQSFKQLTEGHFSQAFSYETTAGDKRVLRLAQKAYSFEADQYAYEHFHSAELPVPKVLEIGESDQGIYYCISQFAPGVPSDRLSAEDFAAARENMERVFAEIFVADISHTSGSGDIDIHNSNGSDASFQEFLQREIDGQDLDWLREQCAKTGTDPGLVDAFLRQFNENISKVSTTRRLIHGDLGADNILVQDGKVTAVIDWSGMGYGDWLHDYSRVDFWYPGKHAPANEFGPKYGLEMEDFDARWLVHMAAHAISTLSFAYRYESLQTQEWCRHYLPEKIGTGVK